MGRMTEKTMAVLYKYGKKVFTDEINLNDASEKAHKECPEVASSSAKHYINWYTKMREGDFLTWNTNSTLLLTFAENIIKDEGTGAGKIAIVSAKKFAVHAARKDLERELEQLARRYGVDEESAEDILEAWLLTWNSHEWDWKNYLHAVSSTHGGKMAKESWSHSDPQMKNGDRIFLMRLGCEKNGIIASGYVSSISNENGHEDSGNPSEEGTEKKIDIEFDWVLSPEADILGEERLKNIFPDQNWNPETSEIMIQKEYIPALETEWEKIKGIGGKEEMSVSTREALDRIKIYIAAKGFSYNDELIENFFLSLKSKPFVILAGTSGTGKTRLVRLFAEAISAEYKLIPVRPDWSDGSDLFGHRDLNGNFIDGPICECFDKAYDNPSKPVFLCLDEMNLARVEYYLSDILSVIESREKRETGSIFTSAIAQYEDGIPENLYIIGTVNMDETTFPFSKKVLDRANTIEFSYVDLIPDFRSVGEVPEKLNLPNSFLCSEYLQLSQCSEEAEYVSTICAELQKINRILQKANAHVGYRVRDEIVFYLLNNKKQGGLLPENEAMDNEIMQKILPRIQGSSASVRDMICELFKICGADHNQRSGDSDAEKMRKVLSDSGTACKYRKSAEKLELMVRRFEEDGFTSYWL